VIGESQEDPADKKKNYVKINAEKEITPSKAAILEVPREEESNVYAIVPQSQWLWTVETKLSVTYFDNTRLIKTLGTQVEDHRIKVIQAIGAIAKSALLMFQNDTIKIPVAIDAIPTQATWEALPSNPGWFYLVTLKNAKEEPDAVPRKKYFDNYEDWFFSFFSSTRTLPTSSCREAYLEIGRLNQIPPPRQPNQTDAQYEEALWRHFRIPPKEVNQTDEQYADIVREALRGLLTIPKPEKDPAKRTNETDEQYKDRVKQKTRNDLEQAIRNNLHHTMKWPIVLADYRFLRTYALPDKGSISMHTLCGADITTEKADATTSFEVLAEIVKQAKDIKDSQK
jgi:hypothetical protein